MSLRIVEYVCVFVWVLVLVKGERASVGKLNDSVGPIDITGLEVPTGAGTLLAPTIIMLVCYPRVFLR